MADTLAAATAIGASLRNIPKRWDGKRAIVTMKEGNSRNWRQMEWIGFYFQYLCEEHLSGLVDIPGPKYGKVSFDGFFKIPWDFKAHAINTSSHQLIVNDSAATASAIEEFGAVGLVLALGDVEYNDESREFQRWHSTIKGGESRYERERVARGAWSRRRKVSFDLQQVSFIEITDATLVRCGSFQVDFRNADGRPRRAKVLVDLEQIDREMVHYIDFE